MKKKLLSLFMACAMALSLAIPAFAADPYYQYSESDKTNLAQSVEFTVKTFVPTIDLQIPVLADNPVVLNPYKLTYAVDPNTLNGQEIGSGADKTKQVISPVYAIQNKTNVALKFTVSTNTTLGSSAAFTFDTKHVKLNEPTKKAFIQFVFSKTASDTQPLNDANEQFLDVYDTAKNEAIVLVVGKKDGGKSLNRLAAATTNGSGETVPNFLLFQFQGSLSRTPETGWTADDVFTTTLSFTFTPEGNQDYEATLPIKIVSNDGVAGGASSVLETSTTATTHTATTADGAVTVTTPSGIADATELANATDAGWTLLSNGAYGASVGADGKITYSADLGKTLTIAGSPYKDYLVVGFNDEHGVPKTIGITVTIARAAS